uniref:FUM21 n=1 Tax=Fusarium fujikuroi TaxID=5127 RepID=A0A0M3KUC7_FUSFU|nr:FUM21 [Fusarium fujikuroi]BBN20792.1 Zn(II)2Cys6 type-transcriptional regulator [Fusarium fujikuroi]
MTEPIVFVEDNPAGVDSGHKPRFRRRRGACESCKRRKVRCNGSNPCNQCQKSSIDCQYKASSWKTNDGYTERGPSESPLPIARGSLTPPQTVTLPSPIGAVTYTGSVEESSASGIDGSDPHSLSMRLSNTGSTINTDSTDISQWQDWLINSDVPFGDSMQLTGTSDDFLTDWLDPQLVNPPNTAAITQTLSGENLSRPSGLLLGTADPLPSNSDSDLNGTRNELIASFFHKLRSQRPFILCDGNSETILNNNTMGHREFHHTKFISRCLDTCYADPEGIRVFLERKSVDSVADEVAKGASAVDRETSVLFHSVMAIGCHGLSLEQGHHTIGKQKYSVSMIFKEALYMRQNLRDKPTLRGLQALLTMAYFSGRVGDDSTSSLLADAAVCAQTLELHSASAIEKQYNSSSEQQVAKRALWFLNSLEKPRCLAEGLLPLIHDDLIDYDPPSSASHSPDEVDWFAINARFATICYSIIRERPRGKLGRSSPRRGQGQASQQSASSTISRIESLLDEWRGDLPFASESNATESNEFAALTCSERRHRIKCLNKYWSAVIATHSGQARVVVVDGGEGVGSSKERCVEAAQEILKNSHYITSTDILYDISLYYYITVATRVIMTAVIREAFAGDLAEDRVRKNTKIPRKETRYGSLTSYMGIAIGLFSRLSLDIDVPVDEVTEL